MTTPSEGKIPMSDETRMAQECLRWLEDNPPMVLHNGSGVMAVGHAPATVESLLRFSQVVALEAKIEALESMRVVSWVVADKFGRMELLEKISELRTELARLKEANDGTV
jgi:hypothetical protein